MSTSMGEAQEGGVARKSWKTPDPYGAGSGRGRAELCDLRRLCFIFIFCLGYFLEFESATSTLGGGTLRN